MENPLNNTNLPKVGEMAEKSEEKKRLARRRYYLHSKLKKQGVSYRPKQKAIYIPHNTTPTQVAKELRDIYGYVIQLEIV